MAVRQLQRRLSFISLLRNQPHIYCSPRPFLESPKINNLFGLIKTRSIQTNTNPRISDERSQIEENPTKIVVQEEERSENITSSYSSSVKYKAISSLKTSSRHDLAMIFTCNVCETRSVRTICRESYEKGVVVARCDGCKNLHLIADRLGMFGEPASVEDFLAARGEQIKKGNADTFNLTLEDLAGISKSNQ